MGIVGIKRQANNLVFSGLQEDPYPVIQPPVINIKNEYHNGIKVLNRYHNGIQIAAHYHNGVLVWG